MNLFKIVKRESPCFVGGEDIEKHFTFSDVFYRDKTWQNITSEVLLKEDVAILDDEISYYEGNYKITWYKNDVKPFEKEFSLNELESL